LTLKLNERKLASLARFKFLIQFIDNSAGAYFYWATLYFRPNQANNPTSTSLGPTMWLTNTEKQHLANMDKPTSLKCCPVWYGVVEFNVPLDTL